VKCADLDALAQDDAVEIDGLRAAVEQGAEQVTLRAGGKELALALALTERQRHILLAGGLLNYTRDQHGGA